MGALKINLLIRGHVRGAFQDQSLLKMARYISSKYDLSIFIHTWNILQNDVSWRRLTEIKKEINESIINDYFSPMKKLIKIILIDDDSKIQLHGNTEGNIGRTPCPVRAWKNMYYGKVRLLDAASTVLDKDAIAIQTRFDLFNHQFSPSLESVVDFISKNYGELIQKENNERIRFLEMRPFLGVDNIYMAKISDMSKFVRYMYFDMDRILKFHEGTFYQEHISFHERLSPFLREESL